jgi:hypothetical protein
MTHMTAMAVEVAITGIKYGAPLVVFQARASINYRCKVTVTSFF